MSTNTVAKELQEMLQRYRDYESSQADYITYYGPRAKYAINPCYRDECLKEYVNIVQSQSFSDDNTSGPINLCLAECNSNNKLYPLIVEMNFSYNHGYPTRGEKTEEPEIESIDPFNDDFLQTIIWIYQEVLEHFYITQAENFYCCVLESKAATVDNNRIKFKLRLQFPNALVTRNDQIDKIHPMAIDLMRQQKINSYLNTQPIGDWNDIINIHITNGPITMYGSSENSGDLPLEHLAVYTRIVPDDNGDVLAEILESFEISLESFFDPANHSWLDLQGQNVFDFFDVDDYYSLLPILYSIRYGKMVLKPKFEKVRKIAPRQINLTPTIFGQGQYRHENKLEETPQEAADNFLAMISPKRYFNEGDWIAIGQSLYDVYGGEDEGLKIWIEHTTIAHKETMNSLPIFLNSDIEDTANEHYETFELAGRTLKTLAYYAKLDDPDEYKIWHDNWCYSYDEKALELTHTDIAASIYRNFWLDYVCTDSIKSTFYKYTNHRWIISHSGISLLRSIISTYIEKYEMYRYDLVQKQLEDKRDPNTQNTYEQSISNITALIKKLKSNSFKKSVLKESIIYFFDESFRSKLDKNQSVMGLPNGVLEALSDQVIYRCGYPEDFISKSTSIRYNKFFNWNSTQVKRVLKWLRQMFIDRDLLDLVLKWCASIIKGRNKDKKFPILTGKGNNSKSLFVKLLCSAFGAYSVKLPFSSVMKRADANGPTPALARCKNARLTIMDEPDDNEKMKKALVKILTGGDAEYQRGLFEEGGDVENTYKTLLQCNGIPSFVDADEATKNRVLILPCLGTWVENAPETEDEQFRQRKFPMDPDFEDQIPHLAPAFLWICAQYYPRYVKERLKMPQIVQDYTKQYWEDNDIYSQFLKETIVNAYTMDANNNTIKDRQAKLSLTEIHGYFVEWYRDCCPGARIPDRIKVRTELINHWGPPVNGFWEGLRFVEEGENISSEIAKPISPLARGNLMNSNLSSAIPNSSNNLTTVHPFNFNLRSPPVNILPPVQVLTNTNEIQE